MTYRAFVFKADQNPDLCMDYGRHHTSVLAEYGCGNFHPKKEAWMDHPNVYVVSLFDEAGDMVGGVRLHLDHRQAYLPIETTIQGLGNIMRAVRSEAGKTTAEFCGLWTARSLRGRGLEMVLSQTVTALAHNLGASSLFTLASVYTRKMYQQSGYIGIDLAGRYDDFLRPASDYVSVVMIVPELETMEHAHPAQRSQMQSLRNYPAQVRTAGPDGSLLVEYHLDRLINAAPAPANSFAVAA